MKQHGGRIADEHRVGSNVDVGHTRVDVDANHVPSRRQHAVPQVRVPDLSADEQQHVGVICGGKPRSCSQPGAERQCMCLIHSALAVDRRHDRRSKPLDDGSQPLTPCARRHPPPPWDEQRLTSVAQRRRALWRPAWGWNRRGKSKLGVADLVEQVKRNLEMEGTLTSAGERRERLCNSVSDCWCVLSRAYIERRFDPWRRSDLSPHAGIHYPARRPKGCAAFPG